MTSTGGTQLRDLPEPPEVHRYLARHHPLSWGAPLPTKAELLAKHGQEPVRRALETLCARAATEPTTTAEFVAALSDDSTSYKLESRVKSPQSLARKYADLLETLDEDEPDDVLRSTMLTESPNRRIAGSIGQRNSANHRSTLRLRLATGLGMHSYTGGSRYKGIHVGFRRSSGETIEVQFHSNASARVKEATTPPYEVERSAAASPAERSAARVLCI